MYKNSNAPSRDSLLKTPIFQEAVPQAVHDGMQKKNVNSPPPLPTSRLKQPSDGVPVDRKNAYLQIENDKAVFYRGEYVSKIPLNVKNILFGRRDVMAGYYPDVDLAAYWKDDPFVSRRHLRIYCDINGCFFVEDLCGNRTTFYNNKNHPLINECVALHPGDKIYISNAIVLLFCVK